MTANVETRGTYTSKEQFLGSVEELERIIEKNNYLFSPQDIVDAVKRAPKRYPFLHHRLYSMTDEEAANEWRIVSVKELVRHVKVRIVRPDQEDVVIRAFHSVRVDGEHRYTTLPMLAKNESLRYLVINDVIRALEAVQNKLLALGEFDEYVRTLEDVIDGIK